MRTVSFNYVVLAATASALGVFGALSFVAVTTVLAHDEEKTVHVVLMTDTGYEPADIVVKLGDTVAFKNVGEYGRWPASNIHPTHSVYPGTHIDKCGTTKAVGMFDACDEVLTGETFSFTFLEPGNWRYHDHVTPAFNGLITVEGKNIQPVLTWREKLTNHFSNWWQYLKLQYNLKSLAWSSDTKDWSVNDNANDAAQLELLIQAYGAESVMEQLLAETDGGALIDCHSQAHEVGKAAYKVYGANVFETGDESCHSGFYHGAMEGFIADIGTVNIASSIEALCENFNTTFGLFSCLHGVGHGVLAYEDYDLLAALAVCEELSTQFAQSSCYGGVFMENVVTAQNADNTADHATAWVDYDNPLYPCTEVADNFAREEQCYLMQTSWMLHVMDYNFETVATMCTTVPERMRSTCFTSFGRDAAGYSLRNPEEILRLCDYTEANPRDYESCIEGAVNVILDFWGATHTNQAHQFCDAITTIDNRVQCNQIITNRYPQMFEARE